MAEVYTDTREQTLHKIKHDLSTGQNVDTVLNDLGTFFRNSENRLAAGAQQVILEAVVFFEKYAMEALRVLVNFAADNTENRRFLLSNDPLLIAFWAKAVNMHHEKSGEAAEIQDRFLTFVKQFIYDVDDTDMRGFIDILVQKHVVDRVFSHHSELQTSEDDREGLAEAMEFLVEYARLCPEKVTEAQFRNGLDGFMACVDPSTKAKDPASMLTHADFLLQCTNVEDSKHDFPVHEVVRLAAEVPDSCTERGDIHRRLFATCGNVYAYPSHDNWQRLPEKVAQICRGSDFGTASAAISLGNCVSSPQTRARLLSEISAVEPVAQVAESLLRRQFYDVVYYQAYHFFNNAMDALMAAEIMTPHNAAAFFHSTKVVVDNFPYYKEIGHLYLKFVRKLVAFACIDQGVNQGVDKGADPIVFLESWEYLIPLDEATHTALVLLQAIATRSNSTSGTISSSTTATTAFMKTLLTRVLKLGDTVDIATLLEQIKALAVAFKLLGAETLVQIYTTEDFTNVFLKQVLAFLHQLHQALETPATPADPAAPAPPAPAAAQNTLRNNAGFLAVVVRHSLEPVRQLYEPKVNDVYEVAGRLVAATTNATATTTVSATATPAN